MKGAVLCAVGLKLALFQRCHGRLGRGGPGCLEAPCHGVCLLAKLVASNSSFARMVVPCVVQLCQVLLLCPRRICGLFFFFFFLHLSNAAYVIVVGKKIGAKEYFCISAVEHPYLLLIYCFCFPQDFFGARRRVLCRCPGLLTYAWQMSRRAYLFCVASYRTA